MRPIPSNRIHDSALLVWRITGILVSFIFLLVAAAAGAILTLTMEWPWWLALLPVVIVLLLAVILIFIVPAVRHRRWRYEVSEEEIDLQHGVFIIRRTLIPMVRVQHVDTKQGPLLRCYGLATVSISTAALGVHEIPALSVEVADRLRDRIALLARVTDDV